MDKLIENIINWILNFIDQFGYSGIFLLSVLESAAIPIPSEIVVPFSGFLASENRFNLNFVIILTSLANLGGGITLYFISSNKGRPFLEKFGKYVLISKEEILRAQNLFQKYGEKIIFIGRMLPIVRTFISIPAGISKMNFTKFSLYTFFGSLPWNFALAIIGFKIGKNWQIILPYFKKFEFVIIFLIALGIFLHFYFHIKKLMKK